MHSETPQSIHAVVIYFGTAVSVQYTRQECSHANADLRTETHLREEVQHGLLKIEVTIRPNRIDEGCLGYPLQVANPFPSVSGPANPHLQVTQCLVLEVTIHSHLWHIATFAMHTFDSVRVLVWAWNIPHIQAHTPREGRRPQAPSSSESTHDPAACPSTAVESAWAAVRPKSSAAGAIRPVCPQ